MGESVAIPMGSATLARWYLAVIERLRISHTGSAGAIIRIMIYDTNIGYTTRSCIRHVYAFPQRVARHRQTEVPYEKLTHLDAYGCRPIAHAINCRRPKVRNDLRLMNANV